jgi:hypothetical protein
VDPICDGILVEEQRSAPFPVESTHVTQDIICEEENSGQTEESPVSSRPTWPEGGGLKEKDTPEEVPEGGGLKAKNTPEEVPVKITKKQQTPYVCLELLNLAVASLVNRPSSVCTLRPEEHVVKLEGSGQPGGAPSGGPEKRGLNDQGSTSPLMGLKSEERSATSSAKEYVVSAPIALEPKQLRPMLTCMRCVLDYYSKEALRTVNNPVKMKHEKQCLLIEEPVQIKDDKEDDQCQAMEKPIKAKTVTWMLQGTTKAMSTRTTKTAKAVPRVTPTRSKWRIWDPGRCEAHVVLRGVIVSIKHVDADTASCAIPYTSSIRPCI